MGGFLSKLDPVASDPSKEKAKVTPEEKPSETESPKLENIDKKTCDVGDTKREDPEKQSAELENAPTEHLEKKPSESETKQSELGSAKPEQSSSKSSDETTQHDEITKSAEGDSQDQPEDKISTESHSDTPEKETEEDLHRVPLVGKPRTVCDMLTEASRHPLPMSPCVDSRTTSVIKNRESAHSDLVTVGKTISSTEETPSSIGMKTEGHPEVSAYNEASIESAATPEVAASTEPAAAAAENLQKNEQLIAECVMTEDSSVTKDVPAQDEVVAPVEELAEQLSNVVISTAAKELGSETKIEGKCDVISDVPVEPKIDHQKEEPKRDENEKVLDIPVQDELVNMDEHERKSEQKVSDMVTEEPKTEDVKENLIDFSPSDAVMPNN